MSENEPILWKVKFLDCCLAGPVCLLACCCPAIVQSLALYKIDQSVCCRCLFAQYCCCIGLSINRGHIRKANNQEIEGSKFLDCLLYSIICCCCHACLATQEYRQVSCKAAEN